ncbi:uncharacterized protein pdgfbb isoform X2 [Cheilinus undulatus]|nr:uncharacterized protein pdgfbb isoform X2 [Cheilinus undulatus]
MLDRSNANFLLWPPCVEVQRCSGCCNTKSLQCVPFVTHTRYLQVMKVEYVNKRPTYAKAVVSVVDHVECRCQPSPRPSVPKRKSSRRQHNQHRNQTLSHGHTQVKVHSKDELHQWDELKPNQRAHLEDLLEQNWSPRGDSFSQPRHGYSLAKEESLLSPHLATNSTRLHGTKDNLENVERRNGHVLNSTTAVYSLDNVSSSHGKDTEGSRNTQTQSPLMPEDQSKISKGHTSGFSYSATHNPQLRFRPTKAPSFERVGTRFRPTKEPNPEPRELGRKRGNETPEEARTLLIEEKLEQEKKELLLLHKRLDKEKELLRQQQKQEEEDRQKAVDMSRHHHMHGKHHHHHHLHTTTTTTQKPATTPTTTTTTTTTRQPLAPAGPVPPVRPKRRMRKNRKRISKAAMRAMLM